MAEPLGKLDVRNLCDELTEVVDWHQLGIQLGIPPHLLATIEANHQQNERRKTETLDLWLRRTPSASWGDVVGALRRMELIRVAENIAAKMVRVGPIPPHVDDSLLDTNPALPELLNFQGRKRKINIAQEIGIHYTTFGILLLNDRNGARVDAIALKRMNNAQPINTEVLQEWLAGSGRTPVSWRTLIGVLRDLGLNVLADDIEATFH